MYMTSLMMWSRLFSLVIFLIVEPNVSCKEYYGRELGVYYPFMYNYGGTASLHTSATDLGSSTHRCGAILISERHLLTSASCMTGNETERLVGIGLGRRNLNTNNWDGKYSYAIEEFVIHPEYGQGREEYNDLAILKTDRKVQYNGRVYPYCLPERNHVFPHSLSVNIAGWGYQTPTYKSSIMQHAYIKLLDIPHCVSLWLKHASEHQNNPMQNSYPEGIDDRILCGHRPGISTSIDDSGGPMTYQYENGVHALIGVIGWRNEVPIEPKIPEFFINISHYVDWIYATTGLSESLLSRQCGGPPWLLKKIQEINNQLV